MREFQWTDLSDDIGMVREARGGSFIELWLRHVNGNVPDTAMGEHPEATHMLAPDGARAVADALYQAAFEIDGKGATVAELTAQLEQARAEIERYKQATNSLIEKWKTIAGYQSCDDDSCDDDNPYNTVVRDLESVLIGNNDPQCLECVYNNDEFASDSVIGDPCNAGRKG